MEGLLFCDYFVGRVPFSKNLSISLDVSPTWKGFFVFRIVGLKQNLCHFDIQKVVAALPMFAAKKREVPPATSHH